VDRTRLSYFSAAPSLLNLPDTIVTRIPVSLHNWATGGGIYTRVPVTVNIDEVQHKFKGFENATYLHYMIATAVVIIL